MSNFRIRYYHDYISLQLANELLKQSRPVAGVTDLQEVGEGGGLETTEALNFLVQLYNKLEPQLNAVLEQRIADRKFIDERVKACHELNKDLKIDFLSNDYVTPLGLEDGKGRIVFGPLNSDFCRSKSTPIAPVPQFLEGPHVTLFGPPGTAKMAINAMNAYHRKIKGEPDAVEKLLATQKYRPMWGADDEDSKTPLREDLVNSAINLTKCFEGVLTHTDEETGKNYALADRFLSIPIKRFPGLALPCSFLFYKGSPIPLHLYDFALHLFKNWNLPESLVFYVPKLENEEEAAYIHNMVREAENMIQKLHPNYKLGSVRLMIVLENPRAILRTHEIMDALYPYFVGASLGWHDYLASTARLFKEDSNYRIPVKADPDIVIKYIKASHNLLADVVGSRGGIKVGGMYGILPLDNDFKSASFQITIKGYIKDVVTQMKRNLTGFWVAHPDFVRLGLALVEGWRQHSNGQSELFFELIKSLLEPAHQKDIFEFINKNDVEGLDKNSPKFVRSLIVADIKESDFIANNHPDEIRYNVFQSLQYITDWLCGNGCVALPAHVHGHAVRVMDDLATAERSRWEVWHEIYHGRFGLEEFLKIAFEEFQFIRKDLSNQDKIVQVKWSSETEKWYPIAFRLMIQLMTSPSPVEFATELLMPFTVDSIRRAEDPLNELRKIDADKYSLAPYIDRFIYHFEVCGCVEYAKAMAAGPILDLAKAERLIRQFDIKQIIEAASFHGNIGESKKSLDHFAVKEQALVFDESENIKFKLKTLGEEYLKKFEMKFLISAQGKTAEQMLNSLETRLNNTSEEEIKNAQLALWEISKKRYSEKPLNDLFNLISEIQKKHKVLAIDVAVSQKGRTQNLLMDKASDKNSSFSLDSIPFFQIASLSKSFASAFAIEYFTKKNIDLSEKVNGLLKKLGSPYLIEPKAIGDLVEIKHLLSHSALNMHYVNGIDNSLPFPNVVELLNGNEQYNYKKVEAICYPGSEFHYSGGGFLVLEHLIELLEKKNIQDCTFDFLNSCSLGEVTFANEKVGTFQNKSYRYHLTSGFFDGDKPFKVKAMNFPAFAAGAHGTARGVTYFLNLLTKAYADVQSKNTISHDTACLMLNGTDNGSREFMGCDMGLGIFVAECGENKIAFHQGANEGFRALFCHAVSGPNAGDGFTLLCNADNNGVACLAELAQLLLKELNFSGVDFSKFQKEFSFNNLPQEQIVNLGYKKLIISSFCPTLPEEIVFKGPINPLFKYNTARRAKILKVSNQRFARAENMLSDFDPIFDPELFGKQGKIMDSWESARHNSNPPDFVEFEVLNAAPIRYVSFSTKFHDGNQAEFIKLFGRVDQKSEWVDICGKLQMRAHGYLNLKLNSPTPIFKYYRIEMYPDGGFSRLGLYADLPADEVQKFEPLNTAEAKRFSDLIPKSHKPLVISYTADAEKCRSNIERVGIENINLAGVAFGAKLLSATNEHYGPAIQVLSPFPAIHMFDGLESARSRDPGHFEEVIIELAMAKPIKLILFDFTYFVNNNPKEILVQGLNQHGQWIELIAKINVKAFAGHKKIFKVSSPEIISQLKLRMFPDGGINRIKVY
jgi:malate synthase